MSDVKPYVTPPIKRTSQAIALLVPIIGACTFSSGKSCYLGELVAVSGMIGGGFGAALFTQYLFEFLKSKGFEWVEDCSALESVNDREIQGIKIEESKT